MVFSGKINQAQSVSDDLIESQNLRIFYAMSVFFSIKAKMPPETRKSVAGGISFS